MKNIYKKTACVGMAVLLICNIFGYHTVDGASSNKDVGLSKKTVALKIKNTTAGTKYEIAKITVTKAKGVQIKKIACSVKNKDIVAVSVKGKTSPVLTVKAKKKGSTKVTVSVKYRKNKTAKSKKFTLQVKVAMVEGKPAASKEPMQTVDWKKLKKAGMYNGATGKLEKSWDELKKDGYVVVDQNGGISCKNRKAVRGILVMGNEVKFIHHQAFHGCTGLNHVKIPDGVTMIDGWAFEDCSGLLSVDLPDSLTEIEIFAFVDCIKLKGIFLPANVKKMDRGVFAGCTQMTSMVVDGRNKVFDSRNGCNAIIKTAENKLMNGCRKTVIPQNVESMEGYAFYGQHGIREFTVPGNVKYLGDHAFGNCNELTSINILEGVESLGRICFSGCKKLKKISIPNSVIEIGMLAFENTPWFAEQREKNDFIIVNHLLIGYGKKNTGNIVIPEGVISIENYAFAQCKNITSIKVPDSVTKIGIGAFKGAEKVIYSGTATGSPWEAKCVVAE